MSDLEKHLKSVPLAAPSPGMDATVEQFFHEAAARRSPFLGRPIALWQCALACLLCCLAGFLASLFAQDNTPRETRVTERIYYMPGYTMAYRSVFDARTGREIMSFSAPEPAMRINNGRAHETAANAGGTI